MSSEQPLGDQGARTAAATLLDSNAFIEAGAGTGKSTTLVSRIINCLVGPAPVPITSIAAITFTERAGAELRHRLRERIANDLVKAARESVEANLISCALKDLDSASIGTIHSFAQRILRTHALSARLPLGFAPAAGAEAAEDSRSRVRATIEYLQANLDSTDQAMLAAYGLSAVDLIKAIRALDSQWLRLNPEAFYTIKVNIGALCESVAQDFESFLLEARDRCMQPTDRLMMAFEEGIPDLVNRLGRADPLELAAMWAETEGNHPVFKLGSVGTKAAWGQGGAKDMRDQFKELAPNLNVCLIAPLEIAVRTALAKAWPVMQAHREERARRGIVTFDELLSRARDLLSRDPACRELVHEAFPVILVDEFQDTDPVQWELIRLITSDPLDPMSRPEPGRLIVVGDPKQAVYSFRGADIDTYTRALAEFQTSDSPLGRVFELSTNFRSVGPVIDWVNKVFAPAMNGQPAQVAYRDLDARHRPAAPDPGPAVTVLRDPELDMDDPDEPPAGEVDSIELEPLMVAREIARAVDDGWLITEPQPDGSRLYTEAASFSDIAVLYPARSGVAALLEAMDEAGVPYRSGDAGLVFQRPVVVGLLAALTVIDDPAAELDLWAALKSPIFGCTDIDLMVFREAGGRWRLAKEHLGTDGAPITGPVAHAMSVLHHLRQTLEALQPVDIIDSLLEQSRIMEALAFAPRGGFDADCVRMLRAHAQQFQDEGGVGLPDYLLAAVEVQSDSTRSALPEPDVRDDNAVRLMTIHQAKGLEFPIVVLAAMANTMYDPSPVIGVVSPDRYEFCLSKGLQSTRYDEWETSERIPRSLAERVRLSYVACTRARDHLIVSLCGEHRRSKGPHSSLLWEAVGRDTSDVTKIDETPRAINESVTSSAAPLPSGWSEQIERVRVLGLAPFIAAPSGEAATFLGLRTQAVLNEPAPPQDPPGAIETSVAADTRATRDGRPLGRALHAALDTIVNIGAEVSDSDVEAACLQASLAEGLAAGPDPIKERVRNALNSPLFRQALAAPRRWAELYLAAPVNHEGVRLVEGFADLLFEGPEGLVLVDYKTDESINAVTRQHYAEQLSAYSELIQRATGAPVTARWILHLSSNGATEFEV